MMVHECEATRRLAKIRRVQLNESNRLDPEGLLRVMQWCEQDQRDHSARTIKWLRRLMRRTTKELWHASHSTVPLEGLRRAVNQHCNCGGGDAETGCPACRVWHTLLPKGGL